MTAKEAAAKWNMSVKTVLHLLAQDRIPGAYKTGTATHVWYIPPDAGKPVLKRAGRPVQSQAVPERPIALNLTSREKEAYIMRCASTHSYRQLCAELNMSIDQVRSVYDRLHALYGI